MKTLAYIILATTAFAAETNKAPAISPEAEAEYFRADGVLAHLQSAVDQATGDLQKAVAEIKKSCGDKFDPTTQGKHLVCVAKAEPPKPEVKK